MANSECQRLRARGRVVREFAMKNLVMCFDSTNDRPGPRDATNAEALFRLLDATDDAQLTWYDAGEAALTSPQLFNPAARHWRGGRRRGRPGRRHRRVLLPGRALGAGRPDLPARCGSRRVLRAGPGQNARHRRDAAGPLRQRAGVRAGRLCAARAQPHAARMASNPSAGMCAVEGRRDIAVPVHFLGLWDTVKVPGTPRLSAEDWLGNVVAGRHAVAIDGGYGPFGECRRRRE